MPLYELVPPGSPGTEAALRRMTELAAKDARNWTFIKLVTKIVSKVPSRDQVGELAALLRFFKGYIRYIPDPLTALRGYVELVQAPLQTLSRRGGDCVPLSQRVILREKATGQYRVKPVGEIRESYAEYEALSYAMESREFVFAPITQWLYKGRRPVQKVRLRCGQSFRCTPDHKVWHLRNRKEKGEVFCEPKRLPLSEMTASSKVDSFKGVMCARRIPALDSVEGMTSEQIFIEGLYVAEGYSAEKCKAEISNKNEIVIDHLLDCLDSLEVPYRVRRRSDGVILVYVKASEMCRRLHGFGRSSFDIKFPEEYLSLSSEGIEEALAAYGIGDAYHPKPGSQWAAVAKKTYNTSSDDLAWQLEFMHLVVGRPLSAYHQLNHMGAGHRPIWRMIERHPHSGSHAERIPGIQGQRIKHVSDDGEEEVCDISVAGTRNFVTDQGAVLSNCDDHAGLMAAAALALGMRPKFVVIKSDPKLPNEWSHVYCSVLANGSWRGVDATVAESYVGWEPPKFLARGEWRI